MMSLRTLGGWLCAAGIALAPGLARGETPELRYSVARLAESLDAGLSREDLHALRIEIGAEIRLMGGAGPVDNLDLTGFAAALAASDHIWTVLASVPACQPGKSGLQDAAQCRALLQPLYAATKQPVPQMEGPQANPPAWVQAMLMALAQRTDGVLRAIR